MATDAVSAQLFKQYLLILLQVSVLGGWSEHVFCHLLKLAGCLGGIMKLTVEENKDIAIAIASGGQDTQLLWCGAPVNVFNCK